MLKVWIDSVLMRVNSKLPRRFKNRVKLIVAAIFAKNSVLEETMASIQKLPDVVLRGWGNPYDVLTELLPQYGPIDRDILELVDKERHIESSEIDVARFLYNIVRHSRAKTIIEVGIDFPNANVIVIENSNKFGLSQLHQLRGRVGRGVNQGTCILLFKKNLSENAKKRIKILKSTNDGFIIAEDDMRLRGFGDVLGYQQSGIKDFKIADPVQHEKLFKLAEIDVKKIEYDKSIFNNYAQLIKLYDKADIINEIDK